MIKDKTIILIEGVLMSLSLPTIVNEFLIKKPVSLSLFLNDFFLNC